MLEVFTELSFLA